MEYLLIFLFLLNCSFNYIREVKKKIVLAPYNNYFVIVNKVDNKKIEKWHNYLEKNKEGLKKLAQKFFPVPEECEFQFKFFAYDSLNEDYLIRYFAFKPQPTDIAGWHFIFILDKNGRLKKVFLSEVPLEK
jgi:hypothetical protein